MYQESVGSRKTLGDVDIIFHEGIYHLFHLVLPNHDYIAHAVSNDCIRWRRVENALFIGHPGSWDDSMLWTVHVTQDPQQQNRWRMFYTGLSRRDQGRKQRIGLAVSDNLYTWQKSSVHWRDMRSPLPYALYGQPPQPTFEFDEASCFPLHSGSRYYESDINEGRQWISWRDPFYFHDGEQGWLLCAGRTNSGPIVRRGCVALLEEVAADHFEARPPLFHPRLFDDIEVPNLLCLDGTFYLVGSIREEARVRYWRSDSMKGPWVAPSHNVLMGSGNYAGRISGDEHGYLFWSFFSKHAYERGTRNVLPPPKRLFKKPNGDLGLKTFKVFDTLVETTLNPKYIQPIIEPAVNSVRIDDQSHSEYPHFAKTHGFEIFLFQYKISCFRLQAELSVGDCGNCGLVFRFNPETRDGYYLVLDLKRGNVELRAWGTNPHAVGESAIQFTVLQQGFWSPQKDLPVAFSLIVFGSYIELSIESEVILSLADHAFHGEGVGFFAETATFTIANTQLDVLQSPIQSDDQLATG